MTIAHLLEDFSASTINNGVGKLMNEDALEDFRLTAFEQGYTAGWDDAFQAQSDDQARITETLARNLEDCSFTYQEAFGQMLKSVKPVFECLTNAVLPEVMARTFGHQIVEQLCDMVGNEAAHPVRLVVPPNVAEALDHLVSERVSMPVEIIEESGMAPDMARLQVGMSEREIDSALMLAFIQDAIDAFFYQTEKDAHNG